MAKISCGASEFTREEQVGILVAEARVFQVRGDFPLSLERGQQALELARQCDYVNGLVASLVTLASYHWFINDSSKAIRLANQALELAADALRLLAVCVFVTND